MCAPVGWRETTQGLPYTSLLIQAGKIPTLIHCWFNDSPLLSVR